MDSKMVDAMKVLEGFRQNVIAAQAEVTRRQADLARAEKDLEGKRAAYRKAHREMTDILSGHLKELAPEKAAEFEDPRGYHLDNPTTE
jgi:hypothetical protein